MLNWANLSAGWYDSSHANCTRNCKKTRKWEICDTGKKIMIILKERDQIPHGKFLLENWTDCRDDMMLEDPETNPCLIKKVSWINIFQDSKYFLDSLENICSGTRYVSWMDIFHDFKYFQDKRVSWILWKKLFRDKICFLDGNIPWFQTFPG